MNKPSDAEYLRIMADQVEAGLHAFPERDRHINRLRSIAGRLEAQPVAWSDAKLRGIASDYFPDSAHWPAAMLCLRHLLMEQAKFPPQAPANTAQLSEVVAQFERDPEHKALLIAARERLRHWANEGHVGMAHSGAAVQKDARGNEALREAQHAMTAIYPEMKREHDSGDGHFSTEQLYAVQRAIDKVTTALAASQAAPETAQVRALTAREQIVVNRAIARTAQVISKGRKNPSGETFAEKNARNARVQARYDELIAAGKHGHYETMFRVVREEVEQDRACRAIERMHGITPPPQETPT